MSIGKKYSPVIEPRREGTYRLFQQKLEAGSLRWSKDGGYSISRNNSSSIRFFGKEIGKNGHEFDYTFIISLLVSNKKNKFSMSANLSIMTSSLAKIATWTINDTENLNDIKETLSFLNKRDLVFPFEPNYGKEIIVSSGKDENGRDIYNYVRLTRLKKALNASEIEFYMYKDRGYADEFGFTPIFKTKDLETDESSFPLALGFNDAGGTCFSAEKAIEMLNQGISNAKSQKSYVDEKSMLYIPKGANSENWDFELNKWKIRPIRSKEVKVPEVKQETKETKEPQETRDTQVAQDLVPEITDIQEVPRARTKISPSYFRNKISNSDFDIIEKTAQAFQAVRTGQPRDKKTQDLVNFFTKIYGPNPDQRGWETISLNYRTLSENFIREFKDKLNWISISQYQTLSENFIREFQDKVYWAGISYSQKLSEDFIREFKNKIDMDLFYKYNPSCPTELRIKWMKEHNIIKKQDPETHDFEYHEEVEKPKNKNNSLEELKKLISINLNEKITVAQVRDKKTQDLVDKFDKQYGPDQWDWRQICIYDKLTENFLREFKGKLYWTHVSKFQELSENFIREFKYNVNWYYISCTQKLSEDFINEFQYKIDMGALILENPYCSPDLKIEYMKKYNYIKKQDPETHDFEYHEESEKPKNKNNSLEELRQLISMNLNEKITIAQNYEGYFNGEVPANAASLLGTTQVEASQIYSSFGRANESVQLVGKFAPDFLRTIAFIFNFSKGGAYGVFIPELDRKTKTDALKMQLEQKGYSIVEQNQMLIAMPQKGEIDNEKIDSEIESMWNELNSKGGVAIGLNVQDTIAASRTNADKIVSELQSSMQGGEQPPDKLKEILFNMIAIHNLACTIVHESSHARGGDEGQAGTDEANFRNATQGEINRKYQQELNSNNLGQYFSPLETSNETIHAKSNDWYKLAQNMNYIPQQIIGKPNGSDLKGRHNGDNKVEGISDWSMLIQRTKNDPIEKRLSREYMFPLEKGLSQEHDIIEEQLRKQTKNDYPLNPKLIMEELLKPYHDEIASYQAMETLLENNRPKPLMLPVKKASLEKLATTFGWYNNLSISDGSTIPGLGDRVMAWEDRDEDFAWSDQDTASQARYNQEYDLKGFFYRWIEPRFKPQLWNDMVSDFSGTSPAKRFGGPVDNELVKIINILGVIQKNISEGNTKSTRLIASEDIASLIVKFYSGRDGIETKLFELEPKGNENIYAIWIYRHGVDQTMISSVENYFQNKDDSPEIKEIAESIIGFKSSRESAINEIIDKAREVCKENDIDDLYVVGAFAREKAMGENPSSDFSFICDSFDKNIKIGELISEKLGVASKKMYNKSSTLHFHYKGVGVSFQGKIDTLPSVSKNSPITTDIYNRDFTINMFAYNVLKDTVEDIVGVIGDLKNKIIRTKLSADEVLKENPMIIFRALILKLKYGFEISEDLQIAMIENSPYIFDGRYSKERIAFARESVKAEGKEEAEKLFNEFELTRVNDLDSIEIGE